MRHPRPLNPILRACPPGPGFLRILYYFQHLAFLNTFLGASASCRPRASGLRCRSVGVPTAFAPSSPLAQIRQEPRPTPVVPHAGTVRLPLWRILCVIPLPGMSNHHRLRARLSPNLGCSITHCCNAATAVGGRGFVPRLPQCNTGPAHPATRFQPVPFLLASSGPKCHNKAPTRHTILTQTKSFQFHQASPLCPA